MKLKKALLIALIIYIILSPLMMWYISDRSYDKGQFDGIYIASKWAEEQQKLESPQKHLKVGDKIQTTYEYWEWYGDTTSFTGWVIAINNTGNITVKLHQGSCVCDANAYTLNEYWVEKTDFYDEDGYKGWRWV